MARTLRRFLLMFSATLVILGGSGLLFPGCASKEPGTCSSDNDCAEQGTNKVCDLNNKKCVQCFKDDQCNSGETCDTSTQTCNKGCSKDADCKDAFPDRPNAKVACRSGACALKCDSNADCKDTEKCSDNKCIDASCKEDKDCDTGEVCKENKCGKEDAGQQPGKYEECPGPKGEDCQEGLKCLTYRGGTANYCWKPCSKGCDEDELCVTEDKFAEGHSVCMKIIKEESQSYSYDQGTACSDKLISLHGQGSPQSGSCWKTCTEKCLGDRKCLNHPNVEDEKVKFCFKDCKSDDDCPKGSSCQEHAKAENKFYCF